jgi:hypothetical protein
LDPINPVPPITTIFMVYLRCREGHSISVHGPIADIGMGHRSA